jgi:hypothetical protein
MVWGSLGEGLLTGKIGKIDLSILAVSEQRPFDSTADGGATAQWQIRDRVGGEFAV